MRIIKKIIYTIGVISIFPILATNILSCSTAPSIKQDMLSSSIKPEQQITWKSNINNIDAYYIDSNNNILIAPFKKRLYKSNNGSNFTEISQMTKITILRNILKDNMGNIWLAGIDENVNSVLYKTKDFKAFEKFSFPDKGGNKSYFASLLKDNNGNIWYLADNATYECKDGKNFYKIGTNKIGGATSIYFAHDHSIWISTFKTLWKSIDNGKTFTKIIIAKGKYWGGAQRVFIDNANNIWIIDGDEGKLWKSTDNGKTFELLKSTFNFKIVQVFEDKNNNIWLETFGNGIWKSNDGNNFSPADKNISIGSLQFLYFDHIGNPWIYTMGSGLYTSTDFTSFKKVGIFKDVSLIFEDNGNNIWVSTKNDGLWEITK